ncbi:MAG TPA: VanZ family protein [Pyrinomonadaceae bacterium]|nr:VanZ family protein [Pyrinomonadaceae bacterium]
MTEQQSTIPTEINQQNVSREPRRRLWRYGPLVVWAALIFIGSGNLLSGSHTSAFLIGPLRWLFPRASEETLAFIHLLVRKAGHLTEYAILAALAARAFRTSSRALLRRRWFWAALILAAIYALSDEFHQSFVPSRGASIFDSLIDSVGGLIGLTIFWWRHRQLESKEARRVAGTKASVAD